MNRKLKIANFIGLYKKGALKSDELSEFYMLLKEGNNSDFEELINEEWDKTRQYSNKIKSWALLSKTYNKLGLDKNHIPQPKSFHLTRQLFSVSKYAAVFIIAFALAWLYLHPTTSGNLNHSAQSKYFKIKVAYGSKSTIELPDSSVVVLNSGSILSYPAQFGENNRTVELTGEGYFEVKKDKTRPFYVKTNDVTIKVLGTKFNIKAYPDENVTETTLVTGSVEITQNKLLDSDQQNKILLLEPNQKAIFKKGVNSISAAEGSSKVNMNNESPKPKAALIVQKAIKTELYTAWKSNLLIFNNESFSEIVKKFERWYNVEITLESDQLSNIRFSAKFDRESIQEALDALKLIQSFNYKIHKNKISIYLNN